MGIATSFTFRICCTMKMETSWNRKASDINEEITPITASSMPISVRRVAKNASETSKAIKYSKVHSRMYALRDCLYGEELKTLSVITQGPFSNFIYQSNEHYITQIWLCQYTFQKTKNKYRRAKMLRYR